MMRAGASNIFAFAWKLMLTPRPYQLECNEAVWSFLCNRKDDPLAVIPTAGGKSYLQALDCQKAMEWDGRVLLLAHRKELIQQNYEEIKSFLPDADIGIYSAGLKRRDLDNRILIAGIHSICNKAHEIGIRHLCIIDECHLVNGSEDDSMYKTFLSDLKRFCPSVRKIGYTATPYRLDSGPIAGPDLMFGRVAYSAPLRQLITDGYLCPLTTVPSVLNYDTASLRIRGGEYVTQDMGNLFGDEPKIRAACEEIIARTADRHSILVFCATVLHAERVANELSRLTQDVVGCVTGETQPLVRASALSAFKDGSLRYLVSVDIVTVGFNAKRIDAIAILRATMSPGLLAQIAGRGFRLHESKKDCLVLDFGGNFRRHGPLDDPNYGVQASNSAPGTVGEVPIKACVACRSEVHAASSICPVCGFAFPTPQVKHDEKPDETSPLVEPTTWNVVSWSANRHKKKKQDPDNPKPDTFRIDYLCRREKGNVTQTISEWICIAHRSGVRNLAKAWWAEHSHSPFTDDIDAAVRLFDAGLFAMPITITTVPEGQFQKVTNRTMPDLPGDAYEKPVDEWAVDANDPPPPTLHGVEECPF